MRKIKILENRHEQNKIKEIKANITKTIRPQIIKIIVFLTRKEVKPYRNLLISLLREKLKTYQHEHNLKYVRIYELRNYFKEEIKQAKNEKEKNSKIDKLHSRLIDMKKLKPQSILKKEDKQIEKIIEKMIDVYENEIKP